MPSGASPGHGHVHVALELDVRAEPISGIVRSGDTSREFSGWIALISTLETLRTGEPS